MRPIQLVDVIKMNKQEYTDVKSHRSKGQKLKTYQFHLKFRQFNTPRKHEGNIVTTIQVQVRVLQILYLVTFWLSSCLLHLGE